MAHHADPGRGAAPLVRCMTFEIFLSNYWLLGTRFYALFIFTPSRNDRFISDHSCGESSSRECVDRESFLPLMSYANEKGRLDESNSRHA